MNLGQGYAGVYYNIPEVWNFAKWKEKYKVWINDLHYFL